jgi:hypothetical protein
LILDPLLQVQALVMSPNNTVAEYVCTVAIGLDGPNGVAWHDGNLYVATVTKLLRYDDIDNHVFENCNRVGCIP